MYYEWWSPEVAAREAGFRVSRAIGMACPQTVAGSYRVRSYMAVKAPDDSGTGRRKSARASTKAAIDHAGRKQSRPRRQEVVDAAAAIFRRKGYVATTTQDIGDALGILKGSIYYYIDTKDDLLFAVISEAHSRIEESLALARADEGPVLDRLRLFVRRNVETAIADQDKAAVFNTEFRFLGEERQASVIALRDRYEEFLRRLLREGQSEGVVCPDLDVRVASSGMLSMVTSVASWYRPRGRDAEHLVVLNLVEMATSSVQCGRDHVHHDAGWWSATQPEVQA
jgi:TetR/AcrR family transcriptional regulator, cholesterol catabolism regulator